MTSGGPFHHYFSTVIILKCLGDGEGEQGAVLFT